MIASQSSVNMYRLRLARASERLLAERATFLRLVNEAARAGLSQREIARATGFDHSTVSRWLSAGRPKIDSGQMTIWEVLDGGEEDD